MPALCVFVHGCFWHCCLRHFKAPKTRAAHWRRHFAGNVARDRRVRRQLRALGYATMVVWEHSLRADKAADKAAVRICRRLGMKPKY